MLARSQRPVTTAGRPSRSHPGTGTGRPAGPWVLAQPVPVGITKRLGQRGTVTAPAVAWVRDPDGHHHRRQDNVDRQLAIKAAARMNALRIAIVWVPRSAAEMPVPVYALPYTKMGVRCSIEVCEGIPAGLCL